MTYHALVMMALFSFLDKSGENPEERSMAHGNHGCARRNHLCSGYSSSPHSLPDVQDPTKQHGSFILLLPFPGTFCYAQLRSFRVHRAHMCAPHASALSDFLEDMPPSLFPLLAHLSGCCHLPSPQHCQWSPQPPNCNSSPPTPTAFNAMLPLALAFVLLFLTFDTFRLYLFGSTAGSLKEET